MGFDGPLTYAGLNKVKEKPIPLFFLPARALQDALLVLGCSLAIGVWEKAQVWGSGANSPVAGAAAPPRP